MDKTAIKKFSVWARRKLIEDIQQKAFELGITEKEIKEPRVVSTDTMIIGEKTLDRVEVAQRSSLVTKIKDKGFEQVVEEVAYIWFNRLIALRFMEVNEYLPTGVRVLSSSEPGKTEPDLIREALNTDLDLDRELVYSLQDTNDTEKLYRYLLVKQCNALNDILPGLFEKIADYTEILLPSNLLSEGAVIRELVHSVPEEDYKDQVEIIGWMYQYYISEKKDQVFEGLKKNIKITKENIPAATQLFTPDWIVKYMVENSLGRLWLEGHPNENLQANWKYYLEEAEQEPDVQNQLDEIRAKSKELRPEEIKVLDPAMGSGHILVYAFDVLYEIYQSAGYSERDIPKLILENNLYGLDIDDRAAQLAYFAVMMKARSKSRRIFREKPELILCSIQESNGFPKEALDYLISPGAGGIEEMIQREDVDYLIQVFHDAKEYGSILEVREVDFEAIERRVEEIRDNATQDLFESAYREVILEKIPALVKQARVMSQKYDVVVTNPPYMGNGGFNSKVSDYIKENFPRSKTDLFAVFIEKCFGYLKLSGFNAMITMQSWMFLSSFEKLREYIYSKGIINLIHIGYNSFPELNSKLALASAFVFTNKLRNGYISGFLDLNNKYPQSFDKEQAFLNERNSSKAYFYRNLGDFYRIPGIPLAYWINKTILDIFDKEQLKEFADSCIGMRTGDNVRFLRFWFEINFSKLGIGFINAVDAQQSKLKWFPYNKGGAFRKWYGNKEYVVNWENNGYEIKENTKLNYPQLGDNLGWKISNENYYFKKGITWSGVTTASFGVRSYEKGMIFDSGANGLFVFDDNNYGYFIGLLNSKVTEEIISIINPTINTGCGVIAKIPVIISNKYKAKIETIVEQNIRISRTDWNNFEISWDFNKHPFISSAKGTNKLETTFGNWLNVSNYYFDQLKTNEEQLNCFFNDIYGVKNDLTPDIKEKNITIRKANKERDIKSFISYAVGCMLGRYSIDAEGLIYAGADFKEKWLHSEDRWQVRKILKDDEGNILEDTWVSATFAPDADNVIPITDNEYFEDDIVSRFIEFIKVTFSEETLEENLDFIADTLGRKASETARQTIRRYFLKDFYKDHVQTYQKRPIYWLFDSGKQDGFKALIYMHRYDEFTVAKVRTDYLHKLQKSYEAEVKRLDIIIDSTTSEREKANARKKKDKILKQMDECLQYDQVISHVANQRIQIDLDDGVMVNYAKFQGVEIPQGEGRKPLKADLLAKI